MHDLWVTELMTKDVTTCKPGTLLTDVVKMLHSEQFSCLLVVDNGEPVGIITERDMVTILADMLEDVSWDSLSVANFMSSELCTIMEDHTLFEAVEIIRQRKIRHAPVVNRQNQLIGLLTQTDIINGLYQVAVQETE